MRLRFLLVGLLVLSLPALAAESASPDDTAKFLGGMPVSSNSPLAPLTHDRSWQGHANYFNLTFRRVEDRQLSRVRRWSKANINIHRPTLFYMFSGPDFLYANSFFPDETTYVLSGLEPVGAIPDLNKISGATVPRVLHSLEHSMASLLNLSFFITKHMKTELRASPVSGTLPLLYVFLARSGKTISDVSLVHLAANGDVVTQTKAEPPGAAQGVKITFSSSPGGPAQTLYYFSTNLANNGFKQSGFEQFCDKLGEGVALLKSASYLPHSGGFSDVRNFLLKKTVAIAQDDTGIPVRFFGADWQLRPFGNYLRPLGIFPHAYQPAMAQIFRQSGGLDFGVGYRWRPQQSNLLLAVKKGAAAEPPKPEAARPEPAKQEPPKAGAAPAVPPQGATTMPEPPKEAPKSP
jgi:hypothetical protein